MSLVCSQSYFSDCRANVKVIKACGFNHILIVFRGYDRLTVMITFMVIGCDKLLFLNIHGYDMRTVLIIFMVMAG